MNISRTCVVFSLALCCLSSTACGKRSKVPSEPAITGAPPSAVAPSSLQSSPIPSASPLAAVPAAPQGGGTVIEPVPVNTGTTTTNTASVSVAPVGNDNATVTATAVSQTPPTAAQTAPPPQVIPTAVEAGTVSTTEKVGILECDKYASNYVSCISNFVPAAERPDRIRGLETSIRKWQAMATSAQGRTDAANECMAARDLARQNTRSLGCEWQDR